MKCSPPEVMKFLFAILFLASCSVVDDFNRREFIYPGVAKQQKLVLQVPRGYREEKKLLDTTGGKEQYYYYSNGALIYFTNKVSLSTENDSIIEKSNPEPAGEHSFVYHGIDKDGLYWKEIRHETFRFGYSYVPKDRLVQFEQALNSVKMKE